MKRLRPLLFGTALCVATLAGAQEERANYFLADGRFTDTSLWIEGQRRWVVLKGCVTHPAQIPALEQLVRNIDDVEAVISQLSVMAP